MLHSILVSRRPGSTLSSVSDVMDSPCVAVHHWTQCVLRGTECTTKSPDEPDEQECHVAPTLLDTPYHGGLFGGHSNDQLVFQTWHRSSTCTTRCDWSLVGTVSVESMVVNSEPFENRPRTTTYDRPPSNDITRNDESPLN